MRVIATGFIACPSIASAALWSRRSSAKAVRLPERVTPHRRATPPSRSPEPPKRNLTAGARVKSGPLDQRQPSAEAGAVQEDAEAPGAETPAGVVPALPSPASTAPYV